MKIIRLIIFILLCACEILNKAKAQTPVQSKSNSCQELTTQIEKVIKDFEKALNEEENKMPPLYDNIRAVKMNLQGMKSLIRTELKNTQNFQIDFIPQYELTPKAQIESWAHDSIERYQRAVRNYLTTAGYDLIGWEASALDTVTRSSYQQELLNNWKETNPSMKIDTSNLFERVAPKYMWQDGVLAYWVTNPEAKLTGLQDTRLWKLNIEANSYDVPFSFHVAEFRSYVAMARIIKAIRENKSKQPIRPVIIMGAWHQHDLAYIAKGLGIRMRVVNVMAEK